MAKPKKVVDSPEFVSRTYATSVSLYPGDIKLLEWLAHYLGAPKSEVIRSAIRMMAVHVKNIEKQGSGNDQ